MKRLSPLQMILMGLILLLVLGGVIFTVVLDNRLRINRGPQLTDKISPAYGKYYRLGGFHWGIGEITINFEEVQVGDGNLYVLGSYKDADGNSQILRALVGKVVGDGSINLLTKFGQNMKPVFKGETNYESISSGLKKGSRLVVSFLVETPDLELALGDEKLCGSQPEVCELGKFAEPFQAVYGGLWYEGKLLPAGMSVAAVYVNIL